MVEVFPMALATEEIVEEPRKTLDISAVLQDRQVRIGSRNLLVKIYNELLFCLCMSQYRN
jgi:hypothetical protein